MQKPFCDKIWCINEVVNNNWDSGKNQDDNEIFSMYSDTLQMVQENLN